MKHPRHVFANGAFNTVLWRSQSCLKMWFRSPARRSHLTHPSHRNPKLRRLRYAMLCKFTCLSTLYSPFRRLDAMIYRGLFLSALLKERPPGRGTTVTIVGKAVD
jgi:hypothetical protein